MSVCSWLLQFGFLDSLMLILANPSSKTLRNARNGQGHSFHIKEGDILRTCEKKKKSEDSTLKAVHKIFYT